MLARYNACANRSDAPTAGYHVWNGAHGHYEIGNIFIGWVHAFIDALLENKRLVVSSKGRDYFAARGAHAALGVDCGESRDAGAAPRVRARVQ